MAEEWVEVTLTSSQDQSGIATKLWRNHPERTTKQQLERILITTDRQKNQLQYNLTGRKCGGAARGLLGHPQEAAEVPEGHLSGQREPPEKCGV